MFTEFPKLSRFNREVVVTEKIDGTNAQIYIAPLAELLPEEHAKILAVYNDGEQRLAMLAGSRSRWITPTDDNAGFARWCQSNYEELHKLGPGRHFGEWWGQGIQRNYGLAERRFSLFNVERWAHREQPPACCHVVPELWRGPLLQMPSPDRFELSSGPLHTGSVAAPGFPRPEGIVVYHTAGNVAFKYTFDKDGHKG